MTFNRTSLIRILAAAVVILATVLGAGLLLPKAWHVERQADIAASPAAVFTRMVSVRQWPDWFVGLPVPPEASVEHSGPERGTGATRRWSREGTRGVVKIMDVLRDRRVDYEVLFDGGQSAVSGVIRLYPENGGTRVIWQVGGEAGRHPLARYAALLERLRTGDEIKESLTRLKRLLENS